MKDGATMETNQEQKKEPTKYEKFKLQMEELNELGVLEVIRMIDEAYDHETEDNLRKIREAINNLKEEDVSDKYIAELNKKLRVMLNRTERIIEDNFGSLIRYLREQQDFSLKEMEKLTGISASYINRMEKGERKAPSYPILEKLANALNVDINMLIKVANGNSDYSELMTIGKLMLSNNFTINGKVITKVQKEILVEIIEKIGAFNWSKDKYKESLELVNFVDKYKERGLKSTDMVLKSE